MEHKLQLLEKNVYLLRVMIDKIKIWVWLKYEDEIPKEILNFESEQEPDDKKNQVQSEIRYIKDHENVIEIKQENFDRFLSESNGFDDSDPAQDLDFYEPPLSSDYNENPPENNYLQAENVEQNLALIFNSDLSNPDEICQNQSQSLINDCLKKRLVIRLEKLEMTNPAMFKDSNSNENSIKIQPSQIRRRFTQKKLKLLQEFYNLNAKPDAGAIDKISKQLNMPNEKVFNWFHKCTKSCNYKRKLSKPKSGGDKKKPGPRKVWNSPKLLTPSQKEALTSSLEANAYPNPETLSNLMEKTNLSKQTIQAWFQNRRGELNRLQRLSSKLEKEKGILKCEKCSFTTHLHKNLVAHCHKEHQIMIPYFKFSCSVCFHGFSTLGGYRKHLEASLHMKDSNFQTTQPLHKKKKYTPIPNDNNPSVCETCGRNFPSYKYLRSHISRFHGIDGERVRKYNCTFPGCNASFYTSGHATKHTTTHWDPEVKKAHYESRKIACVTCGKMVFNPSMPRHLFMHDKDRQSIKCDIGNCQKKFAFKYILWEHYRVHMNVSRKEYSEEFTKKCLQEILDFLEKRKNSVKKYATKYNARQKELKKTKLKLN